MLFDLQNDPHELVNLADDREYGAVLSRLRNALQTWQIEQHDVMSRPDVLKRLTAEHDKARGTNYRRDKSFRWDYLDYLPRLSQP